MSLEQLSRGVFISPLPYSYQPTHLPNDSRWTSTRLGVTEHECFANWLIALALYHAQWVGIALEQVDHILNVFKHTTNARMRLIQQRLPEFIKKMQEQNLLCTVEQGSYVIILPTQKLLDCARHH
jgi:hypothetical protein